MGSRMAGPTLFGQGRVTQHRTDNGSLSQYRTLGMLVSPVLGRLKPLSNLSHKSQVAEGCLTSQSAIEKEH